MDLDEDPFGDAEPAPHAGGSKKTRRRNRIQHNNPQAHSTASLLGMDLDDDNDPFGDAAFGNAAAAAPQAGGSKKTRRRIRNQHNNAHSAKLQDEQQQQQLLLELQDDDDSEPLDSMMGPSGCAKLTGASGAGDSNRGARPHSNSNNKVLVKPKYSTKFRPRRKLDAALDDDDNETSLMYITFMTSMYGPKPAHNWAGGLLGMLTAASAASTPTAAAAAAAAEAAAAAFPPAYPAGVLTGELTDPDSTVEAAAAQEAAMAAVRAMTAAAAAAAGKARLLPPKVTQSSTHSLSLKSATTRKRSGTWEADLAGLTAGLGALSTGRPRSDRPIKRRAGAGLGGFPSPFPPTANSPRKPGMQSTQGPLQGWFAAAALEAMALPDSRNATDATDPSDPPEPLEDQLAAAATIPFMMLPPAAAAAAAAAASGGQQQQQQQVLRMVLQGSGALVPKHTPQAASMGCDVLTWACSSDTAESSLKSAALLAPATPPAAAAASPAAPAAADNDDVAM
jgi:hypothetical protein